MNTQNKATKTNKTLTIIGIILCVILIPILIINCTLIIKSFVNKDEVPNIGGTMPLIVLSDSMYPDIKSGDIIICKEIDPKDIKVDDVISFYDPEGNGTSVVTHKVIEIIGEGDSLSFRTKGINNNTEDRLAVPASKVIAKYTNVRIPVAGNIAIFMQTTAGLIICVILPIILFVGYDVIRRKKYEQNRGDDIEALKAELEALRAASATKEQSPTESVDEPVAQAEETSESTPEPAESSAPDAIEANAPDVVEEITPESESTDESKE